MNDSSLRRELRLRDLVFFNICSIVSLRWIGAAAHAGSGSFFLWIIAALFFFLPSAIVVAGLSRRFPEHGGMYIWTKRAFGNRHAFLCGWFYFTANILYFPSLVLAGIGMAGFAFGGAGQHVIERRQIALPLTLAILWAAFAANFFGMKVAKWITAIGGSATFLIGAVLIVLAAVSYSHSGVATKFVLLPSANLDTLNFWSQIAFAFVGLELVPIVSGEIRNPHRDLPKAAIISGVLSAIFYIALTAALLVLLKPEEISPITGLAQAAAAGSKIVVGPVILLVLAGLILVALAGQLDAWIAGNTRLPYAIGLDNYLPPAFSRIHTRWGTPYVSLLVQAVTATLFLVMAQFGESVAAAYQIMVDTMVIVTFIPFLYLFGAGYRFGNRVAAASGFTVTIIATVFSVLPPPEVASVPTFEFKVIGGTFVFALLGLMLFRRYSKLPQSL